MFLFVVATLLSGCDGHADKPDSSLAGSEDSPAHRVETDKPPKNAESTRFNFLTEKTGQGASGTEVGPGKVRLKDVARDLGLQHEYQNGATGKLLMVESIGGGCGWLDFDRDGHLDACFVQGGDPAAASPDQRLPDQLFQQIAGRFVAVDSEIGISDRLYGQGISVGDFDDDGFDDVYITNVGRNSLWRNMGDGSFEDVTEVAGVGDARWSSSVAWADLDLDGDLDLYVCNYLQYDPYDPLKCEKDDRPALCHPRQLPAWPDECYRNRGDGTFEPVAKKWGLFGPGNKGLGVAILDFNQDGWPDIYVANDTTANFLFLNQQGKGFKESALRLGC
ncbi:MAG: VCBS repeat-containing protein, partial [Planctomycetes bacterium]|nr:VCBS repeat-containing protein [Planctomycetota bacterium]